MPVSQSTEYASQVAAASNFVDRIDDSRKIGGEVQYAFITVPWVGDESAAETVILVELPEGAQVWPELCEIIVSTDCAATLTVDVGDVDNPDRYCDGVDAAAVGKVQFVHGTTIPEAVATRHTTTKSDASGDNTCLVTATWATLATPAAGVMHFLIAYKCLG